MKHDFLIAQGLIIGAGACTGLSILALGIITCYFPALAPSLAVLVGGLVSTFTIIAGGDVLHKVNVKNVPEPVAPARTLSTAGVSEKKQSTSQSDQGHSLPPEM